MPKYHLHAGRVLGMILAVVLLSSCASTTAGHPDGTQAALIPAGSLDLRTLSQRIEFDGYELNIKDLELLRQSLQNVVDATPHPGKYLYYYLGYANYTVMLPYVKVDERGIATDRIKEAEADFKAALEVQPDFAEAEALYGNSVEYEIGLNPLKGMFLGPVASSALDHAKSIAPENPRVVMIEGLSDTMKPAIFGGDKQRAIGEFQHALQLFEGYKDVDADAPTWGAARTELFLGETPVLTLAIRRMHGRTIKPL